MEKWEHFRTLRLRWDPPTRVRPRFSLTSDILSYRRCSRQYGYFGGDGFVPARSAQAFFGTVVHQVLDRCHRHYRGLMEAPALSIPTDDDIDKYFDEVANALLSHGIRPPSDAAAQKARRVLKLFNGLEGPELYPRVFDTEHRLESDEQDYVLRGVVDVLVTDAAGSTDASAMEIWDYKATRLPDLSSSLWQDFQWQMCIYAHLYKERSGSYPCRAVLYFLNELDTTPPPTTRPRRAYRTVDFSDAEIQRALEEFDRTAHEIIRCRRTGRWPDPNEDPGDETCDICDIRWTCPMRRHHYGRPRPLA